MVRKLEAGGIGPTNVENAKQLRADWTDYETRWRREVPGSDPEWLNLRARVLDAAAQAELDIDTAETYGEAMLRALNTRLQDERLQGLTGFPMDDRLLLGLAFQLTDECRVWWSRDREGVA
jgi:hypothetical protein